MILRGNLLFLHCCGLINVPNRYGFMMPEKYIRRIGEEMWEGMKVSAKYARNSELGPSKTASDEDIHERRWLSNNPQY